MYACTAGANSGPKRYTPSKTLLSLLRSWEQKQGVGSQSRVLYITPTRNITRGVGKPAKLPLGLDP